MTTNDFLYLFKVVLIGNSCVGKSSIVIRYADDEFSDVFLATIGVDFRFKSFLCNEQNIKLQIWDTAGQQKFRTIASSYYKGAHALMIVFDITDHQSFHDAITYWFEEIRSSCPTDTEILLVGNKSDLKNQRKVSQEEINDFLKLNENVKYIETSAKTSEKIDEAFQKIGSVLIEQEKKREEKGGRRKKRHGQRLNEEQYTKKGYKKYCCQ